jgi:hypothetical protein
VYFSKCKIYFFEKAKQNSVTKITEFFVTVNIFKPAMCTQTNQLIYWNIHTHYRTKIILKVEFNPIPALASIIEVLESEKT